MKSYLWLPRLSVHNANAMPCAWLVAAPSPTAYLGFAHQTGRVLGTYISGVAIVHHHLEYRGEELGSKLMPHQFRGASAIYKNDYPGGGHALSLQPSVRCNVVVSLALEIADTPSIDGSILNSWLARARIAGGTLGPDIESPELGMNWEKLIEQPKTGFHVVERSDLMNPEGNERDRLDAFLRATASDQSTERSWVSPALLGYRAMTAIKPRQYSRDGYSHAFAEPLLGLTQFKSVHDKSEELTFWRYYRPSPNVFLVTTRKPGSTTLQGAHYGQV